MNAPRTRWLVLTGVYFGLSLLVTQQFAQQNSLLPQVKKWRELRHEQILAGTGKDPWTYRVVVPLLVEITQPMMEALGGDPDFSLELAYLFWRLVFLTLLLALFQLYLETWLEPPWALAGTLWLAALQPFAFVGSWYNPDSVPNLVVWVAAALLTLRGRFAWLFPLVLVGTLNREATLFAIGIHAALRIGREPLARLALRCTALGLCWAAAFGALRAVIGVKPWPRTIAEIAAGNFENPVWWLWIASFLGALWVLPWLRFGAQPRELRWMALALAPYFLMQLVFGRMVEARLWLPLTVVLVPMSLLTLRGYVRGPAEEES